LREPDAREPDERELDAREPDERELDAREPVERDPDEPLVEREPLRVELFLLAVVLREDEERLVETVGTLSATAALSLSKSFNTLLLAFLASRCKFLSAVVTSLYAP
jgi:hypothetical protein